MRQLAPKCMQVCMYHGFTLHIGLVRYITHMKEYFKQGISCSVYRVLACYKITQNKLTNLFLDENKKKVYTIKGAQMLHFSTIGSQKTGKWNLELHISISIKRKAEAAY